MPWRPGRGPVAAGQHRQRHFGTEAGALNMAIPKLRPDS